MQERRILSKLEDDYGTIDGHDYIKIGNIKWATKPIGSTYDVDRVINNNVGSAHANYFQWGDTSINTVGNSSGKKNFNWADYKYCNGDMYSITKYNITDNKTILEPGDDAATVLWGDNWRMPTKEELQTLNTTNFNTRDIYYTIGNSYTYFLLLTYKADSSKQLLLPLVSYAHDGTIHYNLGPATSYLSKQLVENTYYSLSSYALAVGRRLDNSNYPVMLSQNRNGGFPILPVVNEKITLKLHFGSNNSGLIITLSGTNGLSKTVVVNSNGDITEKIFPDTYTITCADASFSENIILCSTSDIEKTISCHRIGYVDLGLPSGKKWTTGNLAKDSNGVYYIGNETDYGVYLSWGNIEGYNPSENYSFDQETYETTSGYNVSGLTISSTDASADIIVAKIGSGWHLPTYSDFNELFNNTDKEWITNYNNTGVNGRKFMKKSDHSVYIFMPAGGTIETYQGTQYYTTGSYGRFWTSSNGCYYAHVASSSAFVSTTNYKYQGMPVRGVLD